MRKRKGAKKMEITYTMINGVQIPDIKVLETEETELGVWAMRRKDYLQKEKRTVYYNLLTSCKLSEHLQQIEREAEEMMQMLTDQMKVKEKISEELKEKSPMQWTQEMNNIRQRAKEIVLRELIYN
ncbi:MAG: TnpV protein [Sellimonas sp.]|nr:TnpV protein [Sellimonas sp.]